MAKADPTRGAKPTVGLSATQSLQFKLGLLFLIALLLLAGGAYLASLTLVQEKLLDENFRYEQESGLRLSADLRSLFGDAQSLASALANLASDPDLRLSQLQSAGPTLLKGRPSAGVIASVGIWPEPNGLPGVSERGSLFWLRDSTGALVARNDYNDVRSAPYTRERWYTPVRYLAAGYGYWTDRRVEPINKKEVLTYALPIRTTSGFAGVVTVSLDAGALNELFSKLVGTAPGYAILLDGSQRVIGISGNTDREAPDNSPLGKTIADAAKLQPAFGPIAITVFKRAEALHAAMMKSNRYDAKAVSTLKDGTRDLSRQEADDILTGIWSMDLAAKQEAQAGRVSIEHDPWLRAPGWASFFDLHNPSWTLIRVTPANEGFAGATYLFRQSLVVTLGLVTLTLVLAFFALRALVIRPLRQMIGQLSQSHTAEDALNIVLDESARNEVGMLAHWQNERIRQLRDAMDHVRTARTQLSSESSERRQAQEQLARSQERTALALQSVSDAVVTTDENGQIEDMNTAAESLTGVSLREARGKNLAEVIHFRSAEGETPQNIALTAMERGMRLDYHDGLMIQSTQGQPHEIVLNASPIRSGRRMVGAVLVFHERSRREAASSSGSTALAAVQRHQQDLLTGLPTRAACERRLGSLIDQSRSSGATHAVIFIDIDHLKRINDTGGQMAGDDVLVRVAETLSEISPIGRDVFRIAADHFAVIVEAADAESARQTAEQLRERLANTRFYWESRLLTITASFGVASIDGKTPSATEAIRQADDACAAAKRAGRNTVQVYDPRMDRVGRIVDDDTWVRCIKRGLDENLFHLRTQWILPGKDYAAEGQVYEVLLALEDEEGFWASPSAFMPAAERQHLTTAIDRWVIEKTLYYMQDHPNVLGNLAFCSINLSTATLAEPSFLDFITDCFERYPHFAQRICFELREEALSDHPRESALCCDVLHRIGCRLSVDQYFGRHMSDLTLLRKLPVDFVKVDAQGFKNLGSDPVEQMLAESILRIVRHLRRRVIVNNIDDANTMEIWRKLGADYFQGYAFAKPSPVAFLAPE